MTDVHGDADLTQAPGAPAVPGAAGGPGRAAPHGSTHGATAHTDTGSTGTGTDYEPGDLGSLGQIVGNISQDLSTLVRQELALAKAEVTDSAKKAGRGAGLLGGAGIAGQLALIFLSLWLMFLLDHWLENLTWAALIVTVVWAVVALVLLQSGRKQLTAVNGVPLTVETSKKVPDALKGHDS